MRNMLSEACDEAMAFIDGSTVAHVTAGATIAFSIAIAVAKAIAIAIAVAVATSP